MTILEGILWFFVGFFLVIWFYLGYKGFQIMMDNSMIAWT